jgi:hypothetical protein
MSLSHLGALVYTQPEQVRRYLVEAFVAAKGDRRKAAAALGTTHRTFYRLVERLRLWGELDTIVDEKGFPRVPGPPRTSEKVKSAFLLSKGSLEKTASKLDLDVATLKVRIAELRLADDLEAMASAEGWKCPPLPRRT